MCNVFIATSARGAFALAACCAWLACGNAGAADAALQPAPVTTQAAEASVAPAAPAGLFGHRRVADASLARQRGTGVGSESTLSGNVANNQATQVVTGNNQITNGAFAGATGVPVVIQNSGNNVLIQSSTIVNVTLK